MHSETKKLRIDRIEEGVVIAFAENGKEYTLSPSLCAMRESDILLATLDEKDTVIAAEVLKQETEEKKKTLRARLKNLFGK